jgi:ribosomal-protein-alanine N-acetyltransferase
MIETPRLVLRVPDPGEAAEVARYYRDNEEHLSPWSPPGAAFQLTAGFWQEQLQRWRTEEQAGSAYRFSIFRREEPGTVIGSLGLTNLLRGPLQQCFLGYTLAAAEQGHGYATEAVEAAVQFAFGKLRLHRVAANYMPQNTRSAAVLRRCGFRVEGYAYDYLYIAGRWADHVLTARINPELDRP